MNGKTVSLLVICLVALSIVYGCSATALSSHATRSVDAVPSRTPSITEEDHENVRLSYVGPNTDILGDPIDNPSPH